MEVVNWWLIWSNEHQAYRRPGEWGYTENRNEAGRFTFERAVKICTKANRYLEPGAIPHEAMIPEDPEWRKLKP